MNEITFKRMSPHESKIMLDGEYVGTVYRRPMSSTGESISTSRISTRTSAGPSAYTTARASAKLLSGWFAHTLSGRRRGRAFAGGRPIPDTVYL